MLRTIFPEFPARRAGMALLLTRMVMGIAFLLHGYPKVTDIAGFSERMGVPVFLGAAGALSELIGGALLVLGLLTPVASALLVVTMLFAIFKVHLPAGDPFVGQPRSWELAAVYLVLNLGLLLMGPGAYSLDRLLFGQRRK